MEKESRRSDRARASRNLSKIMYPRNPRNINFDKTFNFCVKKSFEISLRKTRKIIFLDETHFSHEYCVPK